MSDWTAERHAEWKRQMQGCTVPIEPGYDSKNGAIIDMLAHIEQLEAELEPKIGNAYERRLAECPERDRGFHRAMIDSYSKSLEVQIARADEAEYQLESVPQWHDRPTGPGLWVCVGAESTLFRGLMELNEADLKRGAPFCTSAVYGPIPPREASPPSR